MWQPSERRQQLQMTANVLLVFISNTLIVPFLCYDLGGSAAKYLCEHLPTLDTDWSKWRIFFCDERHVSKTDPDSTCGFYDKHLFSRVSVLKDHIFEDNISCSGSWWLFIYFCC